MNLNQLFYNKKLKINVGVVGRFHLFDLALQLKKFGLLNKLITTYPKFITKKWKIDNKEVVSEIFLEILNRFNQIFFIKKLNYFSDYLHLFIMKMHANKCSKLLKECDLFIGGSSSSLEALKKSKKLKKITILERGSPHVNFQVKNIKTENKASGLNPNYKANIVHLNRDLLEYELADYISVPSTFCKKTFLKYGISKSKLILNPYGVDIKNFRPEKKKDKVFRIIFSGTGSFGKGYHYLLRAFYELNLTNSEVWHLGNINHEMQSTFNKYKKENWILKGSISQDQLRNYYSQGSVLILPSTSEGLALVMLQAMACKLPVICTPNTGGEDIIKNKKEGFIIPVRRVDILKNKILYLYRNSNICKKMGIAARRKIIENFTWDHYGIRYLKNINKICKRNNLQ